MGSLLPPRPLPSPASPPISSTRLLLPELYARLVFPSTSSRQAPRRAVSCLRTAPPDADAALMVAHAEAGDFARAQSIWVQLLHSSAAPCLAGAAPRLLPAYAHLRRFDEILLAVRELSARDPAMFKMKSLQRAFLEMVAAVFLPDLTTFNIRAAAFSKMCMFWDLHLSAVRMGRDGVAPDLVRHGCFADAYLERWLARNLTFAFDRLGGAGEPVVAKGDIMFEAFGKGGFHVSSEALLEAAVDVSRVARRLPEEAAQEKPNFFWNY